MNPAFACQGESKNDVQFELNGCLTDSGRSVELEECLRGLSTGDRRSVIDAYWIARQRLAAVTHETRAWRASCLSFHSRRWRETPPNL